ncbi:DUF3696 domain-containing protein [Tsukamurella asaccharolytica]|uniref:DUF3696 domain-containing protein n=1 Tax=Tsukamurella asaccharolytica TaxID=2592067 RepID=A0A5C5R645_9ACTN|nr:DUF3696 domain-containing protein [Tsukamurella asaccharolytica]TWS17834.1 DUF3696 domain-containing protein [Tsukamurella asaccharolytica]
MSSNPNRGGAMDLQTLEWSGFRGFTSRTRFALPNITLLIGKNNVGKSSTYAPLLLLKQTLEARDHKTALLGRGSLVDVGPFTDYVSNHASDGTVTFRMSLNPDLVSKFGVRRQPTDVEIGFQSANGIDAFVSRQRVEDAAGEALITRSRRSPDSSFTFSSPLLPTRKSTGRPYREITAVRRQFREEQPHGFLFTSNGGLFLPQKIREDPIRWESVRDWYNSAYTVFDVQTAANYSLVDFLRSISYLGPLRSLPQRTYRLGAEPPVEIGVSGENAPELLFRHSDQGSSEEVNEWLNRLKYGKLKFDEVGPEYFQALLETPSGLTVNLADTGVGLSQVIPLLVQGSISKPGGTMIAQQPEIHLNPAQQSIVADFLISKAVAGVRVLVETHSEHVLLRLRRRIAEGKIAAEDVAVYFVEARGSETNIRRVPLGELGEISRADWPEGFFEDQLDEAFYLAAAQSVRAGA